MDFRPSQIQFWILDENIQTSAEYLPNGLLWKSITGCMQMLICARLYFIGIRNKKAHQYYFNKEHKDMTLDRFFPEWPYAKPPKFSFYTCRTSKWTRQCKEHYEFVKKYLEVLLLEYSYRFKGKQHSAQKFVDWLDSSAPKLNIPSANLNSITFPWKVLKKKYRNRDIILGYRNQLLESFPENDPNKAYANTHREIPEFVKIRFNLDVQMMLD